MAQRKEKHIVTANETRLYCCRLTIMNSVRISMYINNLKFSTSLNRWFLDCCKNIQYCVSIRLSTAGTLHEIIRIKSAELVIINKKKSCLHLRIGLI